MNLTEIKQVTLQCAGKHQTPISCPEEAVKILLKSLDKCNYEATRFAWSHWPAVLYWQRRVREFTMSS